MIKYLLFALALAALPLGAHAESYPPLQAYMMPRDAEVALALTAAPKNVSGKATVKVLTPSGYKVVTAGTNGFTCMVLRGFAAPTFTPTFLRNGVYDPTVRAPICFNELATKMVLPYYELRANLAMQQKTPDQIAHDVQAAYDNGTLPKRT